MSSNNRIATVEGLTTTATSVDDKHNLRINKYRLVSSDGVLFTVSGDTLRDMRALWDMAQGATSNGEIVLSDEDFEHSHSIRLLLDLLVDGVVGRKDYRLNHIADAFDLTLKYDCHCGYLLCLAYIDQAFKKEPMDETLCEIFILSGELNEMRLVKVVVYEMARTQHKYECDKPAYFDWGPSQLGRVSPTHLWALSQAFHATLSTDSRRCYLRYPHPEEAADKFEELMHGFPKNLATPEQLRGASCRAQNPWATK